MNWRDNWKDGNYLWWFEGMTLAEEVIMGVC